MPFSFSQPQRTIGPASARPLVFVFASTLDGDTRYASANYAARYWGARRGVADGPTGRAYAIPTLNPPWSPRPLGAIAESARRFIDYAQSRPQSDFVLTRIGCGRAGFPDGVMAALFAQAPDNVFVPGAWLALAPSPLQVVAISGSLRARDGDLTIWNALDETREHAASDGREMVLVEGGCRGADRVGADWAHFWGVSTLTVRADWQRLGRTAGAVRNELIGMLGTVLVAFPDPAARDTRQLRQIIRREGGSARALPLNERGLPRMARLHPPCPLPCRAVAPCAS